MAGSPLPCHSPHSHPLHERFFGGAGTHWAHLNSTHFDSPAGWKGLGSVAVSALPSGGWRVASDFATGESQRAHNLIDGHQGWRSVAYQPYAGDGIYRGSLTLKGAKAFDIDPR